MRIKSGQKDYENEWTYKTLVLEKIRYLDIIFIYYYLIFIANETSIYSYNIKFLVK